MNDLLIVFIDVRSERNKTLFFKTKVFQQSL